MRQILPEILLRIPGSVWPTSKGLPVGTGRCDRLQLDREIVAASLPGQVRTKTGFSVGTASVAVAQPRDRQFVPWSPSSDRLIDAGAEAELVAWDERTGTESPLGKWRVAKPAGSLASGQVAVELDESQARGRKLPNLLPTSPRPVDPIWIVDQLARQMGHYSTPAPVASCVLSVPFCGGTVPEVGRDFFIPTSLSWGVATGQPALTGTGYTTYAVATFPSIAYVALNVAGTVLLSPSAFEVRVTAAGAVAVRNGGAWVTQAFTPGLDPDWPTRVELEVVSTVSSVSVRAKSAHGAAWSAPVTVATGGEPLSLLAVETLAGSVSGLQVATVDDPGLWAAPSARMPLLGGTVAAPWVDAQADVWTAIQQVCDSWCALAIKRNDDTLTVLNRHEAAGSGRPKKVIDVDRLAEDISWEVAADDYADRLTVTYWPVTWPDEFDDPPEWPVADRLHVAAGGEVTVPVDLGGWVRDLGTWAYIADAQIGQSEWNANTQADGDGTEISSGITVSMTHPTPSRALVTVRNANAFDVWMTAMTLTGSGAARQEDSVTIVRGLPEIDARFPLEIDLGKTVQTRADADALTSYLWERINRARHRLDSVRLPLDWSTDLGDILVLDHPRSHLSTNALVVGVHIDLANAGMTLDLVALPPTWDDFDDEWTRAGSTWASGFDPVWSGSSWTQFDNDPLKTEA